MKKYTAYLTLALTASFVLSPLVTDPFSGFRADQLPIPQITPPVQPAGYAFAIWGLIYGWLVVSGVYGVIKRAEDPAWHRVRWPLMLSLAVGTPWLAIANTSAIWATVTILVMAASAIAALLRAPLREGWLLRVPVGIYAGWLTAAAFVSLGSTAAGYGVLTGQLGWACIGIVGALMLATATLWHSRSAAYGVTVIWALVGIVAANRLDPWVVSALAGAGIIALLCLIALRRPNALSVSS